MSEQPPSYKSSAIPYPKFSTLIKRSTYDVCPNCLSIVENDTGLWGALKCPFCVGGWVMKPHDTAQQAEDYVRSRREENVELLRGVFP